MFSKTVELYADGYDLVEIAEECGLPSESEVTEDILSFKELCKIARGTTRFTFNTDFKNVLAERFQSGVSLYAISKEIKVSVSTVSKYLKQAGIDTSKTDNKNYDIVENWDDYDCCPKCNSERDVRRLGVHNQDESPEDNKHSFCSRCNTEWYGVVIGEFQGKPVFETRKVRWYTVK